MEKIGNVLRKFLQKNKLFDRYQRQKSFLIWDKVIPQEIRKHAKPMKVLKDILYIGVDSTHWKNALYLLKGEIIKKLNSRLQRPIKDIKFNLQPFYFFKDADKR